MPAQVDYYNRFGEEFTESILACPEPHLWTTDYATKGRVYREIKERIGVQEELVETYFLKEAPVLDVGCGFGRQAYLLARKGFAVTGTDTSPVFVNIATKLFAKHGLPGTFSCVDVSMQPLAQQFSQALLLDVLEHVPPAQRKKFMAAVHGLMAPQGILLLSLPHVKKRLSSQVNNRLRRAVTQHIGWFRNLEEHPYPVPQKSDVLRLTEKKFAVLAFRSMQESDYYVLQRR